MREFPTVPAQRTFHFIERARPGASNLQRGALLVGDVDLDALRQAAALVVDRHAALRTAIRRSSFRHPPGDWRAEHLDLRQVLMDSVEPEFAVLSSLTELRDRRPFRLSMAPLIRFRIVPQRDQRTAVGFTTTHIVSDDWSQAVIWRDFGLFYDAVRGIAPPPPPPEVSFADYSLALFRDREAGGWDRHVRFWQKELRERVVPTLSRRSAVPDDQRDSSACYLDDTERASLQALAGRHGVSTFSVLLAFYVGSLHAVFGWDDLYVFSPYANRRDRSTWEVVGPFANVVMWRFPNLRSTSVEDRVRHAWRLILGTMAHGSVNMEAVAATRPPTRRKEVVAGARLGIRQLGVGSPEQRRGFAELSIQKQEWSPGDIASTNGIDLDVLLDSWAGPLEGQLRVTTRSATVDPDVCDEILRLIRAALAGEASDGPAATLGGST